MVEALYAFSVVLLLCFVGVKIGFATLFVGLIGVGFMRGWEAAFTLVGQQVFQVSNDYNLSVIPLFILMGVFIHRSGIAEDLFDSACSGLSGVRGALAQSTLLACGGFSAVCGSSIATAATMTRVAMPSMDRYGYSNAISTGVIASGGTLGIMIPPSVPLVIYGLLTQQDIGVLFMAAVVPGLLLLLSFMLVVALWARISPADTPRVINKVAPKKKGAGASALAILGLFVLILGGMYGGVFTPTEASGIGAVVAAVISMTRGSLRNLSEWRDNLVEASMTTTNLFVVFFGALVFTQYITLTGMPFDLVHSIEKLEISPLSLVTGIAIIAILLGMIFEAVGILVLLVPVFIPTLEAAGIDMIWFGIIIAIVIELGLITPPIGMNAFVVSNMVPEIPISRIFYGVLPFILAMLVVLALIFLLPEIATFVPSMLSS